MKGDKFTEPTNPDSDFTESDIDTEKDSKDLVAEMRIQRGDVLAVDVDYRERPILWTVTDPLYRGEFVEVIQGEKSTHFEADKNLPAEGLYVSWRQGKVTLHSHVA
ncbi:hypothetical protein [Salinibaculum rarum]|uniref:hypothetical protein n=1 Tax=Salinibaculum rarum TaxID=3058903 RepID=UPI00265E43E6|nr:hypothetical protein [Salinibaculum sp. KK48]